MMEQAPRPRSPPVPPHLKPSDGNDDSINNTSNENTNAVSSTNVTCQEEVQQPPLQSTFRQRRLTATKREMGSAAAAAAAAALAFLSDDDDDGNDEDRKSENDDNNVPLKPSTNDTTTTNNGESVSRVTSGTETVVESTGMNRLGGSFRERRLSGYKRDMGTAAAAAAAAAAFDLSDSDDDDNDDNDKMKEQETNVMPTEEPPQGNQAMKSNSFRERRLSGYKRDMGTAAAAAAAAAAFDLSDSDDDDDNKNNIATATSVPQANAATKADSGSTNMNQFGSPQRKRPRTLSSAPKSTTATPTAAPSMKHMHMTQGFLCAIRTKLNNSKVRRPSKTLAEEKVGKEVWKKDANQPFKSNVVGTFSCHGIEPLYEDEMENGTNANAMDKEDVVLKISTTTPGEAVGVPGAVMSDKDTVVAKINQDRGGVAYPYANDLRTALFAAYDGHGEGGELVAQFTMTEVQKRLESHADYNGDVAKAFKQTFVEVDEALGNQEDIDPLYSGTTACVVLLRNEQLYIANAGDSRAVMARRINNESLFINPIKTAMHAIDLSVDQNPDSPGEQQRIERCGGFVSPPPEPGLSARVWLDPGFTHIGLAMARSIGDHAVKSVGVISEPVVTTHTLHNNDEFMIIATDGVWEFITSDEAVKIVAKHFDEEGRGDASIACQDLIETAALRWKEHEGDYRDDITAVVVKVKELWDKI